MKNEKLCLDQVLSSTEDLQWLNEVRYVCGEDADECLPFGEILRKAEKNPEISPVDFLLEEQNTTLRHSFDA